MTVKIYNKILHILMSVGAFVALTMQAQAQLVTYQFTASKTEGTEGTGSILYGWLTLDLGAVPDYINPAGNGGESARWSVGGFSIDGMTDTGFVVGTSLGGGTSLYVDDVPSFPWQGAYIESSQSDGAHSSGIRLFSYSYSAGDGIAAIPNPWDPLLDDDHFILVWDSDYDMNTFEFASFRLDTFAPATTSIIIDGCDTGILDFKYEGQFVSEYLTEYAATAKNHGAFVSQVANLANELKKAELLTGTQQGVIVSCAAASSIGN